MQFPLFYLSLFYFTFCLKIGHTGNIRWLYSLRNFLWISALIMTNFFLFFLIKADMFFQLLLLLLWIIMYNIFIKEVIKVTISYNFYLIKTFLYIIWKYRHKNLFFKNLYNFLISNNTKAQSFNLFWKLLLITSMPILWLSNVDS